MESKILFNNRGLTILELVLVTALMAMVTVLVVLNVNPWHYKQKGQDNRRLSDMLILERVIIEYRVDHGLYPDLEGLERRSTLPSSEQTTNLAAPLHGWIEGDFREYTTKLPIDPVNDEIFYYSFIHDNDAFELNATLQVVTDKMVSDGGSDPSKYEVGNNLNLL